MATILVTGAAGFIGRALCGELVRRGHDTIGVTRKAADPVPGVVMRQVGAIGPQTDWARQLSGVGVVVHLATSAHRPVNFAAGPAEARTAAALARAAAAAGVTRFVHISSIRAMGETTLPARPFRSADTPLPRDDYGRAKLAIEHALISSAAESGLDLIIMRPPLVYGPGVKGNLRGLIRVIAKGAPLPFAAVDNRRSLISLDNLIDLLAIACTHPDAPGHVLLARDGVDVSTPQLIRALASGAGLPARLFPVPAPLLRAIAGTPRLGPALSRMTQSLQIDDRETRGILGWSPSGMPEAGLAQTARAVLRQPQPGAGSAAYSLKDRR